MASTYTRTQPAQDEDFLDDFDDQSGIMSQIYLFKDKTGSYMLDDALYEYTHEGRPAEYVALALENFENISKFSDEVVIKKAAELAAQFRKDYDRGLIP